MSCIAKALSRLIRDPDPRGDATSRRLHSDFRAMALAALLIISSAPVQARTPELCRDAARFAAQQTGVPVDVLQAITLTETGRTLPDGFNPWPWTVNMEGVGRWFETEDEARAYVFRSFKRGARSFDVGCFQINYKWHGTAFRSIDEMFDPRKNALYAARFLSELFAELGSWTDAAGAYHSRTPDLARAYSARFERIRSNLPARSPDRQQRPREVPEWPLIRIASAQAQSGSQIARRGSLVPLSAIDSQSRASLLTRPSEQE